VIERKTKEERVDIGEKKETRTGSSIIKNDLNPFIGVLMPYSCIGGRECLLFIQLNAFFHQIERKEKKR
jgi:hypothetical protein